jgi:hypothetical protein
MKGLHFVAIGLGALALASGCRGGTSTSIIPTSVSAARDEGDTCQPSGSPNTITVCVRIPRAGLSVTVTDTIYGDPSAEVGSKPCPGSGSAYLCSVGFAAPAHTLNQIQVDASGGSGKSSGAFPIEVGAKPAKPVTAVLGGTIKSIAVLPFHSTTTDVGTPSTLPLGQPEHVWVVAKDNQQEIIVGQYHPAIMIRTSARLHVGNGRSVEALKSSDKAEHLIVSWSSKDFKGSGSYTALIHAYESPGPHATPAPVEATSGVIYFHVTGTDQSFGPGPVAFSPDHRYLYLVANDDSYQGCRVPGYCETVLERFDLTTQSFSKTVNLPEVPGVSQLYVTGSGAGVLWMATFQPSGLWNYALPGYRMSGTSLSSPEPLPTGSFGEPSGFVADGLGNLWISSCKAKGAMTSCKQDHGGDPVLVETPLTGSPSVEATVTLQDKCMAFGYLGFSVGDVAIYKNDLYALGINDGSAPPARGTIWRVKQTTPHRVLCPKVPSNFNPAPYFSTLSNSAGQQVLVFGVGNNANFRWFPNHGFYILSEAPSGKDQVVWDNGPGVAANHVSAAPAPSTSPGILYYASSGKLDLRFSGLGTYEPSANPTASPKSEKSKWSIFPSGAFSGDESDNGVAADNHGAWYTANGVCDPWKGVCLAHAIYESMWGALPALNLTNIKMGNSTGIGVIIDPLSIPGLIPLGAHSGPFFAQTNPPGVCSVQVVSDLTFQVNGLSGGACQITIKQKNQGGQVIKSQPLVTNVTQ